jgi:hypothetical protein
MSQILPLFGSLTTRSTSQRGSSQFSNKRSAPFRADPYSLGDQPPVKETLSVFTREGTSFPADEKVRMERTHLSLATQQSGRVVPGCLSAFELSVESGMRFLVSTADKVVIG